MAMCQTCKGEYQYDDCLCPKCEQPLRRASTVCHFCRAAVGHRRLCPRCLGDVLAWEQEDLSLPTFVLQYGGILGLFPAVVVWLVWLLIFVPRGPSLYYPVITMIAFGLSLLAFIIIYSARLEWREQQWLAEISKEHAPNFVATQIITALVGVGLGAASAFAVSHWPTSWTVSQKVLFALLYIPAYVCLTIVITVSIVENYIGALNARVPQPIFMDPQRVLMVIVSAVRDINMLGRRQRQRRRPYTPIARVDEEPFYEVVEAVRILENGSIRALIHEWLPHTAAGRSTDNKSAYVEMYWRVKSDRWGRVESMLPDSLESYQRSGRMVRMMGQR